MQDFIFDVVLMIVCQHDILLVSINIKRDDAIAAIFPDCLNKFNSIYINGLAFLILAINHGRNIALPSKLS
ncbi:hypothetical protein AYJ66_17195 [Dietzia cinnamea]|nr:hypothetical protein AYJ66_17195 [Dietzia cinnamea]